MTRSPCPCHYDASLPYCSAAKPEQQGLDAEKLRKAGVDEEWIPTAMQCRWCKCVYTVALPSGRKIVRGRLEDGVWTSREL